MAKSGLIKLRLNSAGVVAMLKDPGVAADLARRGAAVHAGLPTGDGEEWFIRNFIGADRAQSIVGTGNAAAKREAAESGVLLSALNRGR